MRGKGRPFQKGRGKTGGRKKGTPNKFRKADLFALAAHAANVCDEELGGVEAVMARAAKKSPLGFLQFLTAITPGPPKRVDLALPNQITFRWKGKPPPREQPPDDEPAKETR